jgi:hypothetical protein
MPSFVKTSGSNKQLTGNQRIMNLYNKNAPIMEKWLNFNSGDNAYAKHMQNKEEACWNVNSNCSQKRPDSTSVNTPDVTNLDYQNIDIK